MYFIKLVYFTSDNFEADRFKTIYMHKNKIKQKEQTLPNLIMVHV